MSEKTYEPYFIIVWVKKGELAGVAVKEIPYREDAYDEYADLLEKGVPEIALAKLVKKHSEG